MGHGTEDHGIHGTEDHGIATIAYRWALDWERHPCGI